MEPTSCSIAHGATILLTTVLLASVQCFEIKPAPEAISSTAAASEDPTRDGHPFSRAQGSQREPRFLLVGNYSSKDNSWDHETDYEAWERENPLYVGDVVIFRYLRYWYVLWQVPTKREWTECDYTNAKLVGNDSAGVELGVAYVVTDKPAFFVGGVFGHCEEFFQKVIINGTLGPYPAGEWIKAPAQIRNPYTDLPPPALTLTPPVGPRAPPPPPVAQGTLGSILSSKEAGRYSILWSLLQPLAPQLEQLSLSTPLTLLAPSNAALGEYGDAVDVALSLLPDESARRTFLANLLSFHVVPQYATSAEIREWPQTLATALSGEALKHAGGSVRFSGSQQVFSQARIVDPDLQDAVQAQKRISVQGIDGLLVPANLSALVPRDIISKYEYGVDPPIPKVTMTPKMRDELEVQIPGSILMQLVEVGLYTNFTQAVNNTHWDLWPYLASLAQDTGVTLLIPENTAFGDPWWLLTADLASSILSLGSFGAWTRNVLLFHTMLTYKSSNDWLITNAYLGTPAALEPTLVYYLTRGGQAVWFSNSSSAEVNATTTAPDLQGPTEAMMSMQAVDRILLPLDLSLLVPASATPVGPTPPASGGGPPSLPPPPPEVPAPAREPRFLLVGNYSSKDNSWDHETDYEAWERENPLYVGDVVIFRYLRNWSVLWQVPTKREWTECDYTNAILVGNDSAGVGLGVAYVVTDKPAFFVGGVFGDCEEFFQKVIINGTLGPYPTGEWVKAPAQIPNPYSHLPPLALPLLVAAGSPGGGPPPLSAPAPKSAPWQQPPSAPAPESTPPSHYSPPSQYTPPSPHGPPPKVPSQPGGLSLPAPAPSLGGSQAPARGAQPPASAPVQGRGSTGLESGQSGSGKGESPRNGSSSRGITTVFVLLAASFLLGSHVW